MKKMYYAIYDGEPEAYRWDGAESYMITVSSEATKEDAIETVTGETGGNCFGPADPEEWVEEFISDYWDTFEEMEPEEEEERILHLAEEWGLESEDLDYLR